MAQIVDPVLQKCIICKKNNDQEPGLKKYKSQDSLRTAAERRRSLSRDHYVIATQDILSAELFSDLYYHSQCHSKYCAVKRKSTEDAQEPSQSTSSTVKMMRSKSDLPKSNSKGILESQCIFCQTGRKRVKTNSGESFDKLCKIETMQSSAVIISGAKRHPELEQSQRVLALGSEDLVAIEAQYHNSCKRKFIRETDIHETPVDKSNRKSHQEAFAVLVKFVESEIIVKQKPKHLSIVHDLYKEQYLATGGLEEDFSSYTLQSLTTKLKNTFKERLNIANESRKAGNFLYPQGMSFDEANTQLKKMSTHDEEVRRVAMALRTEILNMEKTKMPTPTSIHTLKESSPEIPPLTKLFYQTLLSGLATNPGDAAQRHSISMASDAVFTTSRGSVRPWKNTVLGLGFSSLLGSKTAITTLNRLGHTVSYDECKRLETEIAYTCSAGELETPAGLILENSSATGTAWDNYDLNLETLDGKNTLHVTVGIAYQNVPEPPHTTEQKPVPSMLVAGRPRRKFEGTVKTVPPFYVNLKLAKFKFEETYEDVLNDSEMLHAPMRAKGLDFMWLVRSYDEQLPLFNGFYSQFVNDPLPLTVIAYMDPISQPPTRNDVVQETMFRSLKVADETGMSYHPVTYDLAVALKAYSIQALQTPIFDRLIILLGNFHVELAFFGAIGTYIADSGMEYLLTEADILGEGSLSGFIRGKFFNRCTRIHQITATALEKALFERFLSTACMKEHDPLFETIRGLPKEDITAHYTVAESEALQTLLNDYEDFLHRTIKGELGETAAFWAVYVYLINRVYREFQRAIRTNDVELYMEVMPFLIEIFFSLNRPNYARWGSLYLEKLKTLDPAALDVLKAGAFSTRRTMKAFSRSPIDLTLEQTVNRDAASSATGITSFGNSESAFRRWCVSLTQRSMAVSEMKDMSGIQPGETPAHQLQKRRIERDNKDVSALLHLLKCTCNPFANDSPASLVNIASGKAASMKTTKYLLGTLQRGAELRQEFHKECIADETRFLKTVRRVKIENFAAENVKRKPSKDKKAKNVAEGVRDAFGHLLAKTDTDLHDVLCFPITEVPLSLAHADGTPAKTEKAVLTKLLESKQTTPPMNDAVGHVDASIFDGGLVLHEVLPCHSKSTYGKIVRDIMVKVCSGRGDSVHLLLDRYVEPSIKDIERLNRGTDLSERNTFQITGADQQQHKKGPELLKSGPFKESLAQFMLNEIKNEYYAPVVGNKTVYVSHGGKCLQLKTDSGGMLVIEEPSEYQGQHEEADTLMAFHAYRISGRILVRSSDTDVLVILIALAVKMPETSSILIDFGSGNNRRLINVSDISRELEKMHDGLSEALIGFHAVTGCDFTSALYRKGKSTPFSYLEKDRKHVIALRSLCSNVMDIPAVTAYICRIYGFKGISSINEARYKSFIKMTGGKKGDKVKKINCSSLPPCKKSLSQHLLRANYVAMKWRRAHTPEPTEGLHPLNFGWVADDHGHYVPFWFEGSALPDTLTSDQYAEQNNVDMDKQSETFDTEVDSYVNTSIDGGGETDDTEFEMVEYDSEPWSDDSESDYEDDD